MLQFCISHKNLGLRLIYQPLKCHIMQRREKEKEKNENFRMAVGKLLALAGSFVASVVLVSLSHYYLNVKLIFFHIKEKRGLIVRLFMLAFGTWKICFPPYSARLIKKNN